MAKRSAATCLAILALICAPASRAIRYDWTPVEVACAATIDVDLSRLPDSRSKTFERHLAWVADVVVYGTVEEITHDPYGAYHTIVHVRVTESQKGAIRVGQVVFIDLLSGPTYSSYSGRIFEGTASEEPRFSVGEEVLVSLSAGTTIPPDDPSWHAERHFSVIGEPGKWLVEGTVVRESTNRYHLHTIEWVDDELSLAISAQYNLCN